MYFAEPQKKTIQERQIDLPVNKLEFLALYNGRRAGISSWKNTNHYLIVHIRFWSYFI